MPMPESFQMRLQPVLPEIVKHYRTPFHIYDEVGIRENGLHLIRAFDFADGFKEFFAVKALPNPSILKIMKDLGFGFDCSSVPELILSRRAGAQPDDIMFTSNNTSEEEFCLAMDNGGGIMNLDDISLIYKVPVMPELICFRYNPGPRRTGNFIIGNPAEAKYGVSYDQLIDAYKEARKRGARRFGLHTMLASNERNYHYMVETVAMLLEQVERVSAALDIRFEFINMGGGLGIPYRPEDQSLDIDSMASEINQIFQEFKKRHGYTPKLFMESGRYMTGPFGVLVVTAINRKDIYRTYIGVDACMSALMRPGLYGAYHHITVPGKPQGTETEVVDVVGSLCENNDKFAVQRELPRIYDGDLLLIHDTGAHGHAMGFNYNSKLRPKELLLRRDGGVEMIRRAETIADHFNTLDFQEDVLKPGR